MTELPTLEELKDDIDGTHLKIAAEGDGWRAVSSPGIDAGGENVIEKGRVGAPFNIRAVGEYDEQEVGDAIEEVFNDAVDRVFDALYGEDEPLDAITKGDEA